MIFVTCHLEVKEEAKRENEGIRKIDEGWRWLVGLKGLNVGQRYSKY
jgi:hypothetical protein